MNDILQKNTERARQMERHLRLTTLPVGIRLWKNGETIPPDAGERPAKKHSWCQYLTMARTYAADVRPQFLVKAEDFSCLIGPGMLGITERLETILSGEHVEKIHFETKELAKSTMDTLPSLPAHSMQGATVAALENLKVEPDVVFAMVYPGMANRIMDASLWYTGGPYTTSYGSLAGICSSATAQAYLDDSKKVSVIAFPCMGSRRWGGMTDMEIALAVNIKQFDRFIKGLENTYLTGHSYPIGVHLGEMAESHHTIPDEPYSDVYPYCYEH